MIRSGAFARLAGEIGLVFRESACGRGRSRGAGALLVHIFDSRGVRADGLITQVLELGQEIIVGLVASAGFGGRRLGLDGLLGGALVAEALEELAEFIVNGLLRRHCAEWGLSTGKFREQMVWLLEERNQVQWSHSLLKLKERRRELMGRSTSMESRWLVVVGNV